MARPTKQGIDYFPLDTEFDDKVELFIVENGPASLSVLISVWQLIYRGKGYYIDCTDDLFLLIRRRLMMEVTDIKDIIDAAVAREIFSSDQYSTNKILTSPSVQRRYFIAARKKIVVYVVQNYLCNGVSDVGNCNVEWVNAAGNATKVKEEGKRKEEVKGKYGTLRNVSLTPEEHKKLTDKFNSSLEEKINALSEYMASKGKSYKSHYATILTWARKDNKSSNNHDTGGRFVL